MLRQGHRGHALVAVTRVRTSKFEGPATRIWGKMGGMEAGLPGVDAPDRGSLAEWGRAAAAELLGSLGARWQHTLGVARRAEAIAGSIGERGEGAVLVAAAYLHDVGRARGLAATGFHPLDGARFLRGLGQERLACLVANHSGARWEAELRGLGAALASFPPESSPVADALTYCDMTTGPHGEPLSLEERCAEIRGRYAENSEVVRSLDLAAPELREAVARTEAELVGGGTG